MARLDKDRQAELEPKRIEYAAQKISELGYITEIKGKCILFQFNGYTVSFWPYSGWHSGKSIDQGRGLNNLLKQIR